MNAPVKNTDYITGLPSLPSSYKKIKKQLTARGEVGFIYLDIVQFRQILETYGRKTSENLLKTIGKIFSKYSNRFFRKDDLVVSGAKGTNYFIVFLFSPPRRKQHFSFNDLKVVAFRIQQTLQDMVNNEIQKLGIQEKIDFRSGYSLVLPDPQLNIERLIYEAQKEAILRCQLEEIMAQFVADISHELRTPVTCIKGYIETLLEGASEDKKVAKKFLEIINDETDRLTRLINDLLDLSLIESRHVEMHFEYIRLNKVVDNVINILQPALNKKDVKLELKIARDLPDLLADIDRLNQVLINLLDNAIKHSPEGGRIKLEAAKDKWDIKISITDQGAGIPQDKLERIFDKFYRIEKRISGKSGGLGLAIAKQIIEAHGGTISVKSRLNKGTTFIVTLPIGDMWTQY